MSYREPGAYLKVINKDHNPAKMYPKLTPLVIGTGPSIIRKQEVVVRSSAGDSDVFPNDVVSILSVGSARDKADFIQSIPAGDLDNPPKVVNDYYFDKATNSIVWEATATNKPEPGQRYFVTYSYNVGDEQYEPRLVSKNNIEKYYGSDFKEFEIDADTGAAPINRLFVAADIILSEGASEVYVLQVKPDALGKVTEKEYIFAMEEYATYIKDAWRVVPVDVSATINNAVLAHVEKCSSYEERLERSVCLGTPYTIDPLDFVDVMETVGVYTEKTKYTRALVTYPDKATKLLSDGNYYELDAPFVSAAYAGTEAALPVYRSKTRATIKSLHELKGVKMTRSMMNELAAKGVTILTQVDGPGTDITIRHQLTTDMSTVQMRESSILGVSDFCAKHLRTVCEQYIGKYNITGETIALIKSSLTAAIAELIKDGYLTTGNVEQILQDEKAPDSLFVTIRVKPPYPCNYIDIVLFLD